MSRRLDPSEWELLVLRLPCSYCGATPGNWCIAVTSGNWATWLHSAREKPLRDARNEGWRNKEHYIAHSVAQAFSGAEPERTRAMNWLRRLPQIHAESECSICEAHRGA